MKRHALKLLMILPFVIPVVGGLVVAQQLINHQTDIIAYRGGLAAVTGLWPHILLRISIIGLILLPICSVALVFSSVLPGRIAVTKDRQRRIFRYVIMAMVLLTTIMYLSWNTYGFVHPQGINYSGFFSLQETEYTWDDVTHIEIRFVDSLGDNFYRYRYIVAFEDGLKLDIWKPLVRQGLFQDMEDIAHELRGHSHPIGGRGLIPTPSTTNRQKRELVNKVFHLDIK